MDYLIAAIIAGVTILVIMWGRGAIQRAATPDRKNTYKL